jgi:hypothetical protein
VSRDITADVCDPFDKPKGEIPMFSFERPAYLFWQGAYDVLTDELGKTHEQAVEWLKSKHPRWMLDNKGDACKRLGATLVRMYEQD